ncbi:MAG: DUF3830 family protein [Chitinophagaceae bacterium]|nr:DUF3830 family protein [Chitinophagaceae bacterium]
MSNNFTGFSVETPDGLSIRFRYYNEEAPQTVAAFHRALPFSKSMMHARISGMEIWTDEAPSLFIPQENASVFCLPGEVVIGPALPARCKTSQCMGIYYGEGKGLDACNIFAIVLEEDRTLLAALGERIWKKGMMEVKFNRLP